MRSYFSLICMVCLYQIVFKKNYKKIKNIDINLERLIYKLDRQFLHAQTLGFIHPSTNKEIIFTSELPEQLKNILVLLRNTTK